MSAPAPARSASGGGVPARRALVRWSWRLLRREWRSQTLVTVLLAVAVIAAVGGGTAVYNAPQRMSPKLGSADSMLTLEGKNPPAVATDLASIRQAVGTVDVIGHNYARVPGSATPIEYRSQRPHGVHTGPLLAVHSGRYPIGAREAAVTDGVAQLLGERLGGSIALDGHPRTIVGIAENPSDLSDEFVLVDPSSVQPQSLSVLVGGHPELRGLHLRTADPMLTGQGTDDSETVAATLVLAASTILLLLVAFVAAAAFAALAHRRLRQLGMLAAIGATDRQVRLVMTATGFLVGVLAAVSGTLVALALWPIVAPRLEAPLNHRIELSNIPWPLIAALVVLAIAMSTGAAWWPARTVSRLPVTLALSGRPPAPRRAHRSVLLAAGLFAAGISLLAWGGQDHPWPIVGGTITTGLAILFAGPSAIRALAAAGSHAPVAVRLALRDMARHQGRSGAAAAAISLALAVPAATVVIATGAQATPATGNLSDRQMLVKIGHPEPPSLIPVRTGAELDSLAAEVARIANGLPHASVIPLDMAVDPAIARQVGQDGKPAQQAQELGAPVGGSRTSGGGRGSREYRSVLAYVATPELYRLLGVDSARISPATDVITGRPDNMIFTMVRGAGSGDDTPVTVHVHAAAYTSLPGSLLTPSALARRGWTRIRSGWFVESGRPLTAQQIATARSVAATAGLTIQTRTSQAGLGNVRTGATTAGILFALAILAMTVGLIRSEAAADLHTLTATGATRTIRRTLTATTAGALALLGVVIGVTGTCLGLLAAYRDDLAVFGRVPLGYPLAFALGTPLIACVAGWLLAGRELPSIAGRPGD
jgi:putative ABC transport system permease protein